jgi:preprotein translocase subunit SecG
METFVLIVHVVIASVMTLFILMQQGKGAEAGASFGGGGSQTVFGSAGSASFLTKLTAVLAFIFFATSMTLAVFAKQQVTQGSVLPAPLTQEAPAKQSTNTDLPVTQPKAVEAAPAPVVTPVPAETITPNSVENKAVETSNSPVDTVK